MSPSLIEPISDLDDSVDLQRVLPKTVQVCSDPLVVPSSSASKRTKALWWLHGHPHSKRYSDPKLNSLAALVRYDGLQYKGQKAFLYPISAEPSTPYNSMSWDEFNSVTETIALSYAYQMDEELQEANQTRKQPTVALLGAGKSINYFCTQLALQKLGLRVLLLAESNAPAALHFLLETCNVLAVIVDSKNARIDVNGIRKLAMVDQLPESSEIQYAEVDAVKFQDFGDPWERHTFIIHSSGSTGMPKPIMHTNRSMMLIARMYRLFQEFEVENWFLLFPLYHIAGISIALSGLPNGQILSFPPVSWPPSASSIFAAWNTLSLMGHPVHCVHCAPTLIETMHDYIQENGEDYSPLVALKLLQPGGAVLSDSIIQDLTNHGVNVKTTYGSTEIGPPFRSIPHTRDNPKCYSFRNLYPDNPFLKMEQVGDGVYECVVYKGFELAADLWYDKPNNEPYRTNDLFIQDPPESGFYVMQGRKDDILVHSNGENTSASPLQLDIQSSSKIIHKVLALGHTQPSVSLLVEVHQQYDPKCVNIQSKVWQAVKKVNLRYPSHSQIRREMIFLLPRGSTLPVTPKGNVKRKEAEKTYTSDIQRLYTPITNPLPRAAAREPLTEFLRTIFARLGNVPIAHVSDTTSLYDLGIDSRLALSIRTSLSRKFNLSVSLNTIFENPSVAQLVAVLEQTSSPKPINPAPSSTHIIQRMVSRLETEIKYWPPKPRDVVHPPVLGETVLLTGSTGSLGTALLESLSSSSSVSRIYAMVRGPNHASKLLSSLQAKGINTSILIPSGKIRILNFSMQDPLLGLDIETYYHLAESVTMVVQNAWKMDFNKSVEEFEGDCIRSTMSLLRFCYAGRPKRLAFTSSISTCIGPGVLTPTVPESPVGSDPMVALSTGYAQSKYIIERVLQTAALPTSLNIPIHLLRIGQMCGSTKTGSWNTDEMWPIMFATSAHPEMSALPVFEGKMVDWIPVDVAASSIAEILLTNRTEEVKYEVHNIVNPYSIPWASVLSMLHSSSLSPARLKEVSMAEWVRRLNVLADMGADADEVPGLRLLGFWDEMIGEGASKAFETGKSCGMSKSLREVGQFEGGWLEKNLSAWRKAGFLT